MNEQDELKPCPFCGSAASQLKNEFRKDYFVGCDKCGGNAGTVENWNRRASQPASVSVAEPVAWRSWSAKWSEYDYRDRPEQFVQAEQRLAAEPLYAAPQPDEKGSPK